MHLLEIAVLYLVLSLIEMVSFFAVGGYAKRIKVRLLLV